MGAVAAAEVEEDKVQRVDSHGDAASRLCAGKLGRSGRRRKACSPCVCANG